MRRSLKEPLAVSRPRVVGPITLSHGTNEFLSIVFPPIIPLLVTDLGITYAQAGFLITIFFIMYTVFQLPAGVLADWLGKKRLLVAGLAVMALGILLASTARDYGTLLIAQSIAGLGGSTFHPTGMSIISDAEPQHTEGKAMGVFGSGGALGTMASPLLIGGLAALAGWQVALASAAVLGLVVTIVFVVIFADPTHTTAKTDGGRVPAITDRLRSMRPLVDIPLTRGFLVLFAATLVLSLVMRAVHTFTTTYIIAETGTTISLGNLAYFTLLFGSSLSSLWAGSLADRFDRGLLGSGAAVATAVLIGATILVARIGTVLHPTLLLVLLTVWFFAIGVVLYACYPIKNALASEYAEREFSGSLFGIIQTASAIGSSIGPALFGVIATGWGIHVAFPGIAVASVVLAGLFLFLSYTQRTHQSAVTT